MPTAPDRPEVSAAIRIDLGAIDGSLELSRSSWLVTSLSPGGREKMSKHAVGGGNVYTAARQRSDSHQPSI